MRRAIACVMLSALLLAVPVPARAGTSTDIALGLASFAVFNQVVGPMLRGGYHGGPRHVVHHHRTIVTQPAVVYATPAPIVYGAAVYPVAAPVVYTTPVYPVTAPAVTAASPTVVQYPHGRHELRWTGQQYVWVWIPAVPPAPPAPPPPPAAVPHAPDTTVP